MRIVIEAFGHQVMSRQLRTVSDRASDLRPAFEEAHERFREIMQVRFATGGGPPSGPWAPLKKSTVERKARLGLDPRVLHATLRLRTSLTKLRGTGGTLQMNKDGLTMGSKVPYGRFHQTGTRRMVARPPVGLSTQDRRELVQIIEDFILQDVR